MTALEVALLAVRELVKSGYRICLEQQTSQRVQLEDYECVCGKHFAAVYTLCDWDMALFADPAQAAARVVIQLDRLIAREKKAHLSPGGDET